MQLRRIADWTKPLHGNEWPILPGIKRNGSDRRWLVGREEVLQLQHATLCEGRAMWTLHAGESIT